MASRSYNPATLQESSDDGNNNTAYRGCVSKSIHVTGILHIVAGALCIVFGISAIVLEAFVSYAGIPIWGGLLIFITTGVIGVSNYFKPKSKNIVKAYLVMSTISAAFAFLMIIAFSIFISNEDYWERYICHPLIRSSCESPSWSRILIDAALILIFLLELLCGLIAASVTCYKACQCCRGCCKMWKRCKLSRIFRLCMDDPGNSNVVYYAVNMNEMPMMAVPDNQSAGPIYMAGESASASTQPSQFMYVAPSPQPQSFIAMPAVTQQNQTIPKLPPPPQNNQPTSQQQQQVQQLQPMGMSQQPSGLPSEQVGFVQVQIPMQTQTLAQNQQAPEQQSASQPQPVGMAQQFSGLPMGQFGYIQVKAPGRMQPQVLAQTQPAPAQQPTSQQQPTGMTQQMSGLPTGQAGLIHVQVPRQIRPQVFAQAQLVPQLQPTGMAQQLIGRPSGQVGFFQVQGPEGQIQMIPATTMYPQVMMAPGIQQPGPIEEQVPPPGPTGEQVQQPTAPSKSAEAPAEKEDVAEDDNSSRDDSSGQVSSGQFNDKAALI